MDYPFKYKFSVRHPIDYRYLSFTHQTTLSIIFKMKERWRRLTKPVKVTYFWARYYYWKCESFIECKEVKRQDKEIMELSDY